MRRFVIQTVLPAVFCLMPPLAAVLVALAIPSKARAYYLGRLEKADSGIDWLILGLGVTLFLLQMLLAWRALQWRGRSFDQRPDRRR